MVFEYYRNLNLREMLVKKWQLNFNLIIPSPGFVFNSFLVSCGCPMSSFATRYISVNFGLDLVHVAVMLLSFPIIHLCSYQCLYPLRASCQRRSPAHGAIQ